MARKAAQRLPAGEQERGVVEAETLAGGNWLDAGKLLKLEQHLRGILWSKPGEAAARFRTARPMTWV